MRGGGAVVMGKWGGRWDLSFLGGGLSCILLKWGGFSLRPFGAESGGFGRWWREVVKLECGDEVEGEEVVSGKLWGLRFKRWNFDGGFVL